MRRGKDGTAIELSRAEARRLAISSLGLAEAADAPATTATVRRTISRLGLLQIDSVNVLARAHYVPVFSRIGPYPMATIDTDAYRGKRRRLFEYWGREASLIPVEMHPLFRWRMADAEAGKGTYKRIAAFARDHRQYVDGILKRIESDGPLAASDVDAADKPEKGWWGWSQSKIALEYLFWSGKITTLRRETAGFTRIYDLPERALHADVLAQPTPDRARAQRLLLQRAIAALGVASPAALRGFFRLPAEDAAKRIGEMIEEGELLPARVEGIDRPMLVAPGIKIPRRVERATLLSPFDPLVADRDRTERLFDFHYRIEIYTPEHKRRFGYYCLPLLLDDGLVGRLDLRADRGRRTLCVDAGHAEPGARPDAVAERTAPELRRLARWLDLDDIAVNGRGNLVRPLRTILAPGKVGT